MNTRRLSILFIVLLPSLASLAAPPRDLEAWRAELEEGTRLVDAALQSARAELGDTYVMQLRRIARDLQSQGQVRSLVALRDEADRFDKTRAAPTTALQEPPELRDAQLQFIARIEQLVYSNELEVVRLCGRYLQAVGIRRSEAENQGDQKAVAAWEAETARVAGLSRLRRALKLTESIPAEPAIVGQTRSADTASNKWDYRSLRLYRPSGEDVGARLNYELIAELGEDPSRLRIRKSAGGTMSTTSEDGIVSYRVRLQFRANASDLPSGHKLVLSYFSRSLTERDRQKEMVEEIVLPAITRGQSYTAEGSSVDLYRSIANTTNLRGPPAASIQGRDWYGVMIDLRDSEDQLVLQRFSPQSIEKEFR